MKNNKTIKIQLIGIAVILICGLLMLAGTQGTEEQFNAEIEKPVEQQVEETQPVEEKSNVTLAQKNCLQSAMDYLEMGGISQKGISKQLEYEGYTISDIEYAMTNLGEVDWCEQAVKCAQDYLDIPESSYSKTELIRQLQYEGFTQTEAEYGVTAVGY